jgi:hypothetical protein
VDQGHNLLDGKITDVYNQIGNINDNINSMKNDNATANAAAAKQLKPQILPVHPAYCCKLLD